MEAEQAVVVTGPLTVPDAQVAVQVVISSEEIRKSSPAESRWSATMRASSGAWWKSSTTPRTTSMRGSPRGRNPETLESHSPPPSRFSFPRFLMNANNAKNLAQTRPTPSVRALGRHVIADGAQEGVEVSP
ncbi:hypothetical protein ACN469_06305 [Corallococcus terminator]